MIVWMKIFMPMADDDVYPRLSCDE